MDANIQKYQAFVEVADAGSFTKAAETLAYSQSGISHMVSDLERDWGVALFERSRRGVVLTGDGARLLPEARALCESFRALEATVDEVRGLETGLIRIGVFPSVAAHWIPRIIKRFSADYPGIDYKLRVGDYTEIEEWIADGTVDCGFVLLPLRTDARLIFVSFVVHVLIGILVVALSDVIPLIYNVEQNVREMTGGMLVAAGCTLWIHALAHSSYFTIRSGGRTFITLLLDSVFTLAVVVPIAYVLCY